MIKRIILMAIPLAFLISCANSRPDKRDKYVGEYKLYQYRETCGVHEGTRRDFITNAYSTEYYRYDETDSTQTLVVKKDPRDTVSLKFYIVKPFDYEYAERIKRENEEIKKKNEESICGKDIPLNRIPTPTYDSTRDLVISYDGYVDGHKIFLSDYESYNTSCEFDSVYLRNDTLRFKVKTSWWSSYSASVWGEKKDTYIAVKNHN